MSKMLIYIFTINYNEHRIITQNIIIIKIIYLIEIKE
jgi:hypothetical protein